MTRVVACLALVVALLGAPDAGQMPRYDLAIVGGRLVDGTGQPPRRADIAILDGRVRAIGMVPRSEAREVIDARGMLVAPGFIDVHTHADDIVEHPLAENFVRMGVTTVIAGNCGSSALDVGAALLEVERAGTSVNFATLIGHNTVRSAVMGAEDRLPTIGELAKMRSLVWRAMADGAVGFSTGLQYVPGTYAKPPEIIELARIAGNAGGVYATHLRNEGTELEAAVEEAIRVGSTTGARVQISHLKVDSPSRWGAGETALAMIDAARAKGEQVMADQYAYTAASSTLGIRFPAWALEGGQEAIARRLHDPAQWAKIAQEIRGLLSERGLSDLSFAVVASHAADPSLNGLTIKQVAARAKGSDSIDAQLEAARDMMLAGGASMVYHFMSDKDVERIMRHPFVGFASDSGVLTAGQGVPHPRGYGNNARILGEYVRRRQVLRVEEAVRKMTSLPAGHFRLEGRGLLREGYAADVVIFDPAAVRDRATFEKPHVYADGIPYV
ncbi:MAG: N-acyl-D-amino-acid deacylase family protein, partial [Vicinamibacterales bacterium]